MDGVIEATGELLKWLLGLLLAGLILLLLLWLLSTQVGTQTTAATPTPTKTIVLYHYTSQQSLASILSSMVINPSTNNVKYGGGVYVTNLPPTGLLTRPELAIALYDNATLQYKTDYWLELHILTNLLQDKGPVVFGKLPASVRPSVSMYHIYRIAGSYSLAISDKLIDTGETDFRH